jgi:hypothetical protein
MEFEIVATKEFLLDREHRAIEDFASCVVEMNWPDRAIGTARPG